MATKKEIKAVCMNAGRFYINEIAEKLTYTCLKPFIWVSIKILEPIDKKIQSKIKSIRD